MSNLFEFFHWMPFVIGVLLGALYVGLGGRGNHEVIYKYPHPSNVDALVYKDPNGACYRYRVQEVNCDANEAKIKEYPLQ
jgi:hypothetical protein